MAKWESGKWKRAAAPTKSTCLINLPHFYLYILPFAWGTIRLGRAYLPARGAERSEDAGLRRVGCLHGAVHRPAKMVSMLGTRTHAKTRSYSVVLSATPLAAFDCARAEVPGGPRLTDRTTKRPLSSLRIRIFLVGYDALGTRLIDASWPPMNRSHTRRMAHIARFWGGRAHAVSNRGQARSSRTTLRGRRATCSKGKKSARESVGKESSHSPLRRFSGGRVVSMLADQCCESCTLRIPAAIHDECCH